MGGRPKGSVYRACTGCARVLPVGVRCPECKITPGQRSKDKYDRGARGYGKEHQRLRRVMVALALGTACEVCGELMLPGQALDLDHGEIPASQGGVGTRVLYASCNRSIAGRKQAARRPGES